MASAISTTSAPGARCIAGHAHPAVLAAVGDAAKHGTAFGAPYRARDELAETTAASCHPIEQVRMVNSGTEATMSAIRLARGGDRT